MLVPEARAAELHELMRERLSAIRVGDPADDTVRMGPVATAQQLRDVRDGIARLAQVTESIHGGNGEVPNPVGGTPGKGFFVGPVVRATTHPIDCAPLNDHEVFGPVSTIGAYDGTADYAARFVARGEGCLVSAVYSDDRDWMASVVGASAAWAGRLYLGSSKMASQSPGPGTVLPALVHGGPGRAGGGEELGGLRGLHGYMQRTALEGDATLIKSLLGETRG